MILRPEEAQHLSGQEFNIIRTIGKWRQVYLYDVKPVIQVFPEPAFPEPFFEVHIGSGNKADIVLSCLLITDTFVFMVLQKTKKFGLDRQREISDLIQKQGSTLIGCHTACIVTQGACERAFCMTEEFTFKKLRIKGRAGNDPKGFCSSMAPCMDGRG